MTNSKYGKIIAIATTVCIILLGIAFIISCAHLYFTGGDKPFSRESVGKYLVVLAIPSVITIAITVAGFTYAYVNSAKDDELTKRTNLELLESFESRYLFESFDDETKKKVLDLRLERRVVNIDAIIASALCSLLILVYVFFKGEFPAETAKFNEGIFSAFAYILPLTAIAVAVHLPSYYFTERNAKKELELLKASIKEHGAPTPAPKKTFEKKIDGVTITKYAILTVAVAFIILGVMNGGMADVLGKAVRICTECIGLG